MSDPALLARVQEAEGVETRLDPPFTEYLGHLWDVVTTALDEALPGIAALDPAGRALLVVGAAALPTLLLVATLRRLLRRRAVARQARGTLVVAAAAPPPDPEEVLARVLAQGPPRAALAALWAWLGARLAAQGRGRFGPELTEREFVEGVRRDMRRGVLLRRG